MRFILKLTYMIFFTLTVNLIYAGSDFKILYHFDKATGILIDSGPGAYHLTKVGEPEITTGYSGKGFLMKATEDTQTGLYSKNIEWDLNTTGIHIEIWFKADKKQCNPYPRLLEIPMALTITLNANGQNPQCAVYGPDKKAVYIPVHADTADGKWHHYMLNYNPETGLIKVLVDNNKNAEKNIKQVMSSINIRNNPVFIACIGKFIDGKRGYKGTIDEVLISSFKN